MCWDRLVEAEQPPQAQQQPQAHTPPAARPATQRCVADPSEAVEPPQPQDVVAVPA